MNLRDLLSKPPKPVLPIPSQEAITPARPASLRSDVAVPLLQAFISGGLLAGIVVFLIAQIWPSVEDLISWWFALSLFLTAVFWLGLLADSRRLLWAVERWFEVDLDRDSYIGSPARRTLEVNLRDGHHHELVGAAELKMDDKNLIRFAQGLHGGRKLTEGEWGNDSAFPSGINEFRRVRSRLLQRKLIEPIYPGRTNSPFQLTRGGKAFVREIAERGRDA